MLVLSEPHVVQPLATVDWSIETVDVPVCTSSQAMSELGVASIAIPPDCRTHP